MKIVPSILHSSLSISLSRYSTRNLCILNMSSADGEKKACVPCSGMDESHLLPVATLPNLVATRIPLWELAEDQKSISRTLVARNFQAALDAMNAMGVIAESQSHHPDFHLTQYRQLQIVVATHKLNGLTEVDFVLAELLDQRVPIDYSPKWLREHPEAQSTAKNNEQDTK